MTDLKVEAAPESVVHTAKMQGRFARTPEPPYVAVIATTQLKMESSDGYVETAKLIVARALSMPGCLGAEAARGDDGFGIIVSYFTDENALAAWRDDIEHCEVKKKGKRTWYQQYRVRIAKVERFFEGPDGR